MRREDAGRGNYYFDGEMSKAIIQIKNSITYVVREADTLRAYLKDRHAIDIRAVRPRGIILSGDSSKFRNPKERHDFRLLSQGIKNLTVVTYDELLRRLLYCGVGRVRRATSASKVSGIIMRL